MWLETVLLIECAAAFWLAALNTALLGRVVLSEGRRARRAAAFVLASVCAAGAMESLWSLWTGPQGQEAGSWAAGALLVVRTAVLVSAALLSLLLLRGLGRRRERGHERAGGGG